MLETIRPEVVENLVEKSLEYLYRTPQKDIRKRKTTLVLDCLKRAQLPASGRVHLDTPQGTIHRHLGQDISHRYVDLPEDLEPLCEKIHKDILEIQNEKENTRGFLRRLFLLAETKGDIKALLPDVLYKLLSPTYKNEIYNSAVSLNAHAIGKFMREEEVNIQNIKARALTNILLGG